MRPFLLLIFFPLAWTSDFPVTVTTVAPMNTEAPTSTEASTSTEAPTSTKAPTATCDTWTLLSGAYYYIACTPASWAEARKTCYEKSGVLASIPDEASNSLLQTNLLALNQGDTWIGGYLTDSTTPSFSWIDESTNGFTKWAAGQPTTTEYCMAFQPATADWKTDTCTTAHPYVCKAPGGAVPQDRVVPNACPADFIQGGPFMDGTTRCYKSGPGSTWATAEATCAAQGAHLPRLNAQLDQFEFIFDNIWTRVTETYWASCVRFDDDNNAAQNAVCYNNELTSFATGNGNCVLTMKEFPSFITVETYTPCSQVAVLTICEIVL